MREDNPLDPRLAALLDELQPVSARDPQAAARARARFLAQAVSLRDERRHSAWMIFPTFPTKRKEQFAMNILISALVIAGLLFGGGATVAAAQDALPNEPLYQIKLLNEDAQLWLAADPAAEINLLLEQAQTRTEEMTALAAQGIVPDEALVTRTQERIQQALRIAASLDDIEMTAALLQIRTQLQTQEQLMAQLQDGAGTCLECEPILQQTRDMIQTQLGLVNDGLADPQTFRSQNQNQNQYQNQVQVTQTPLPTDDGTIIPTDDLVPPTGTCTPALDGTGQQNGNGNPSPIGTPMPQNGGGNDNGNPSPIGTPPMPQNGGGNDNGNPSPIGTPMPQNGEGNGPGAGGQGWMP